MNAVSQFKTLFTFGLKNEWRHKERMFTPVLFSLAVILLFKFTSASFSEDIEAKIMIGQILVTCFLALQIILQRTFELDDTDGVFTLIQTYRISPSAWFCAKFANIVLLGLLVIVVLLVCMNVLNPGQSELIWMFFVPIALAVLALSPLGILLSALTAQANGRQILFPILYFPLSTPVLISSSSVCLQYATDNAVGSPSAWLGLLVGMSIIFFTLCLLLFAELVD